MTTLEVKMLAAEMAVRSKPKDLNELAETASWLNDWFLQEVTLADTPEASVSKLTPVN